MCYLDWLFYIFTHIYIVVLVPFQIRYASQENPRERVNDLLDGMFEQTYVPTHSLTRQNPRAGIAAKPKMDEEKLLFIIGEQ